MASIFFALACDSRAIHWLVTFETFRLIWPDFCTCRLRWPGACSSAVGIVLRRQLAPTALQVLLRVGSGCASLLVPLSWAQVLPRPCAASGDSRVTNRAVSGRVVVASGVSQNPALPGGRSTVHSESKQPARAKQREREILGPLS